MLVVDDEPAICRMLSRYFSENGFRASGANSIQTVLDVLAKDVCDLILLDLNLAGEDGLDLMRALPIHQRPATIIITARRKLVERIVGLELGADDYIVKPFHLREVLARARNVLRRRHLAEAFEDQPEPGGRVVCFEGWRLNFDRRQLIGRAGNDVSLTGGEFKLLSVFVEHAGRVLNRQQLMDLTHGPGWHAYDRTIDAQVARLRKKIETDSAHPALIKSVHGAGYVFAGRTSRPEASS